MNIYQLSWKITVFIQYYTWFINIRYKESKNWSHQIISKMYAVNKSIILSIYKVIHGIAYKKPQEYLHMSYVSSNKHYMCISK